MSFFCKLFNKENAKVTKEQKQIEKKLKNLNRLRYNNKKILSAVEIENSSFGKKKTASCDLSEFLVKEDNIDHVLASLEKIYEKSDRIMEECYEEIYNEIMNFFEEVSESILKDEFDLEYLKKNWYLYAIKIYDDYAVCRFR